MYMGVIRFFNCLFSAALRAPHVYGGDPQIPVNACGDVTVLPMYMGVILVRQCAKSPVRGAPHVYGGDPSPLISLGNQSKCSPCIWG